MGKVKIRTRERGSKWDPDGKLGVSGAIQASLTELSSTTGLLRGSRAALYPIWLHRSRDNRVTYHVVLTFQLLLPVASAPAPLHASHDTRLAAQTVPRLALPCRDHAAPMTMKLRLRHSPSPAPLSFDSLPSTPPPSPPPASLSGLPPPTSWLSARDMKIFGADPLKSTSEIGLVQCKDCAKPILRSAVAEHAGALIWFMSPSGCLRTLVS